MDMAFIATAFFTLFVVIDPVGTAPLFVALTRGMSSARRRGIAVRACVIGLGILTVFGLFGRTLLDGIGITLPAFRISGGLLLFLIAVDMLFERRTQRREDRAEHEQENDHDPSVFPLATPLIAGPGSMAAMILLMAETDGTILAKMEVLGVMVVVVTVVFSLFLLAAPIERLLGRTGVLVVTRVLGVLLAALSVQFVVDGLTSLGVMPVVG